MRVLFIGERPESVDFSDPALPPGTTADKIRSGIDKAMKAMAERGWNATLCLIEPDDAGVHEVERSLQHANFDCVVIGGGIRVPPKSLLLFEKVLNAVHSLAPQAAIAFNSGPDNTPEAAARWAKGK